MGRQPTPERSGHSSASAVRFRKPSWRDPRLLVGLLLVLLSVVAGTLAVMAGTGLVVEF